MGQTLNKVEPTSSARKLTTIHCVDINSMLSSIGGAKHLVNKIEGTVQKPLPELLKEYDIAIGIFPRDTTNYKFSEETGKLIVYIPIICEVGKKIQQSCVSPQTDTGYVEKGKLADVEGIKTKVVLSSPFNPL